MRALLHPWIPQASLELSQTSICYFQRTKSHNPCRKRFTLLSYTVYLSPDEKYEPFFDYRDDLRTDNVYSNYINSTALIGPKKLKNFLTSLQSFLLCCFFSVFIFRSHSRCFWKNIKICFLENICQNRWFSVVYFKVAVLGNSGPKSSKVAGFILVFAVMLNWREIPVKNASVYWSCRFYVPILCKVLK